MMGTEERKTEKRVAPSGEVFEYIIFRAADIKDLHVCEPPPLPRVSVPDPAVISFQSGQQQPPPPPPPQSQQQQQQQQPPHYGAFPSPFADPQQIYAAAAMRMQQQQQQQPPAYLGQQQQAFRPTAPVPPVQTQQTAAIPVAPASAVPVPAPVAPLLPPATTTAAPAPQQPTAAVPVPEPAPTVQQAPAAAARKPLEIVRPSAEVVPTAEPSAVAPVFAPAEAQQQQQQAFDAPAMPSGMRGGRGGFGGGDRGRRFRQGGSAFSGPAVTKDQLGDFDFTGSNSKFDKEKLREEFEGPTAATAVAAATGAVPGVAPTMPGTEDGQPERPPVAKAYDKQKSFFDSLSCDSLNKRPMRGFGATARMMQQQQDGETFGFGSAGGGLTTDRGGNIPSRRGGMYGRGGFGRRGGGGGSGGHYAQFAASTGRPGQHFSPRFQRPQQQPPQQQPLRTAEATQTQTQPEPTTQATAAVPTPKDS